jgi:hypothetical protein
MKYIIECTRVNDWVRSCTFPNTYTYKQAKEIVLGCARRKEGIYRMTPVERTTWGYLPRTVTREEFLDTLVDVAKERLIFDVVHKYLPFPTRKAAGHTHNHIVNDGVYPVQTEKRTIRDGETLCGRFGSLLVNETMDSDCPGCFAIARGLAVRDLV